MRKSGEVAHEERGSSEQQKQAASVCAVSVLDIDHVDLWASAVSEAFWDATGGFNSTHLDVNYTPLAAHLRFSIEAPFSAFLCPWACDFLKDQRNCRLLILLDSKYQSILKH